MQRSQVVRYQGMTSNPHRFICCVPLEIKNGSIVLPHPHKLCDEENTLLLDVRGRLSSVRSPLTTPVQTTANYSTGKLEEWKRYNKVTVNHSKMAIMHVITSTAVTPPPEVTIGGSPLQMVVEAKLLGVTIDRHLS